MSVKRKKLAPLPRVTSKTITGGALLRKIKRLILAEPKRLDMRDWITLLNGKSLNDTTVIEAPACGTVACLAGWGATLLRPNRLSAAYLAANASEAMTEAIGVDVNGLWDDEPYRDDKYLFEAETVREFHERGNMPDAGTPEHAAVIAKRIDTYLAQHPEVEKRVIVVAEIQKMLRA